MMNMATPADAEAGPGRNRCCDPGVLEELACRATGIAKQAAYNAEHTQELQDAQVAYAGARDRYSKARYAAAPLVAKARKDLDGLVDKIRCQLERDDQESLERAFAHVVTRLDRCGAHTGCCCEEDCDVDDVEDCDPDDVPGRKAHLRRQVSEAKACFDRLIAEPGTPAPPSAGGGPTSATTTTVTVSGGSAESGGPPAETVRTLPERVADVQSDIAKIADALHKGTAEPTELYAEVLVAQRHLDTVWRGFANVNEYIECLCRCLTTMVKGYAAISVLVRKEAVHECYRASWEKACKRLEDETVAEVIAEYLRICSHKADEDEHDDEDEPDDGDEHDHDHDHHDHDHDHDEHHHHDHDDHKHHERKDDDGPNIDIEIDINDDDDDRPERRPESGGRRPASPADDDRRTRRASRSRPRRPYTDEAGGYRAP